MLAINNGSGFALEFENGWTASIQFGPMHYCANRDDKQRGAVKTTRSYKSANAEIAAFERLPPCLSGHQARYSEELGNSRGMVEVETLPRRSG